MSGTPEHAAWEAMRTRCRAAPLYLEHGIKVCAEWQHNFPAFLAHVGLRPGPHYSLDRIDNDGNYEPGNVQWATRTEQNNNRRPRRWGKRPGTGPATNWINRQRNSRGQFAPKETA